MHEFGTCVPILAYAHIGTWWHTSLATGHWEKNKGKQYVNAMLKLCEGQVVITNKCVMEFLTEKGGGGIEASWPRVPAAGPWKRIPPQRPCQIPAVSGSLISEKQDSFSPLNCVNLNFVAFILCSIYTRI